MPLFEGVTSIDDYLRSASVRVEQLVSDLADESLFAADPSALAAQIVEDHTMRPIGVLGKSVVPLRDGQSFLLVVTVQPHPRNVDTLNARDNFGITPMPDPLTRAFYRSEDAAICISVPPDDAELERIHTMMIDRIDAINKAVKRGENHLQRNAESLLLERRTAIEARRQKAAQFAVAAETRGFTLHERTDAIKPINVAVKKPIEMLRDVAPRKAGVVDAHMAPEAVDQIVGLISQAGRGFETAPHVYRKLGEEDLRTIILGYLNAVFESDVAKGEVFSKKGKTDIYFNNPGGGVLIAECKKWGGPAEYPKTIEQLLGYLTVRHATGMIVIFSERKGLTAVVRAAQDATRKHDSDLGTLEEKGTDYFISRHRHADDSERDIVIHHLFFNLFTEGENHRGPRKAPGAPE